MAGRSRTSPPERGPHVVAMVPTLVPALVLALALAGCAGSGHDGASSSPSASPPSSTSSSTSSGGTRFEPTKADFRAVRRVLGRRAAAVRSHDESAFLATVDPDNAALRAREKVLFANMSGLSLSGLRYAMDGSSVLVPSPVPGKDPVLRPQITEFLQIGGAMAHPVTNGIDQTFVRRHGHWVLGADVLQGGTASFSTPQWRPWAGTPIVSRRVGPMTVLVDQSHASTLGQLTTAVHDDIGFDAGLLGVPASYRIIVDATSNGVATSFSSTSKAQAAAVTFPLREGGLNDDVGFKALAGLAIKVNPKTVDSVISDNGIMRHELTHYLLHQYGGASPQWLSEGVAAWVQYYPDDFSRWVVPAALYDRLMRADHTLPPIGLFNEDPALNYPISQAAVAWLVQTYGVAKLLDLMRAYRSRYAGANVDALTPALLRQVYGVTPAQVTDGAWRLLAQFAH
jgi:hypothetical protein